MHIKQFTEAFQWDGQSLAPRALGGRGWGQKNKTKQTNILHQTKTMCSVNKPAIRFGLRLSCIHRNKLGKRGQLQDSFLSLICYIESSKMETKHSNLNSPEDLVGLQIYLKVLHVRYIQEKGEEGKKNTKVRRTSSVTIISKPLP